jgi:hypothetical protein
MLNAKQKLSIFCEYVKGRRDIEQIAKKSEADEYSVDLYLQKLIERDKNVAKLTKRDKNFIDTGVIIYNDNLEKIANILNVDVEVVKAYLGVSDL